MQIRFRNPLLALSLGAALTAAGPASAQEGLTPLLPGVTTGIPVGALPPPGVYVTDTLYSTTGKVKDRHGHEVPVKVANYANNLALLWASPYRLLGARYGAGVMQIVASHGADSRDLGGSKTRDTGLFNTIVQPAILSWRINDAVHVSATQTFYLKNGDFSSTGGVRDQTAYANDFWTYEPSLGLSYLRHGLNLTANLAYDFNARNHTTDYRSGNTVYLDLTAAKTVGRFTYGVLGNVTRQVEDDKQNGTVVGDGNRVEHVMAGALFGYQLGRYDLKLRYLGDLRTRNDVDLHTAYLSVSTRL